MKVQARKGFKSAVAMLALALVLLLAACGGTNSTTESGTEQSAAGSGAENSSGIADSGVASPETDPGSSSSPTGEKETTYPLTITDVTGTELTFEQAPERVITLAPSETEVMFAIGSGEQIVGVDAYSNYPAEAASKTQIGDMTTNIEAVTGLNPDLVVASAGLNAQVIEQLRSLGIKVYAADPKTYDETIEKIGQLGIIMNKQEQAAAIQQHMKEVKQQVVDAVQGAPKVKVFLEFSPGWTVGSGEFLDELVTLAGGTNVAGDQKGWVEVNSEQIVQQNPEIIIYPKLDGDPILPGIKSRSGWSAIDAVKNNKFAEVADDPLVRVGPRLADGLLELAKAIHPDLVH